MPHQCLKCGHIFEEGSPQLLKGCPHCGGNRFFYTKKPLDELARQKITEEIGKDIYTQLVDLLGQKNTNIIDKAGNWVTVKPKDVRKVIQDHLQDNHEKKSINFNSRKNIERIMDDEYRKKKIQKIWENQNSIDHPETIDIEPPGKYSIDVKRLLENEPIIIQKDGSYTIHLPSVFKLAGRKNEKTFF